MESLGVILFGIAATVIGGLIIWMDSSRRKKCSVETEAEVIEVKRKSYGSGSRRTKDYTPTVKFIVDGTEYSGAANIASIWATKFKVGQTFTIKYDVNDPNNFYVKGKVGNIKYGIAALIIGIICICGYIFLR